jgi:hypothetical protein
VELGIPTGGTAPKGWLTEQGPQRQLLRRYGLVECTATGYPPRTKANVIDSDATLIIGPYRTGGSALTAKIANDCNKPMFHVSYAGQDVASMDEQIGEFRYWLERFKIRTLNVAGNRESQTPGLQEFTREFLIAAIGAPKS